MADSPTSRTLQLLRAANYTAGGVEKWIPQTKQRIDLFGFIDLGALHKDDRGLLGVQATSGSNHAARRTKIMSIPAARLWCECGNRLWIVSWTKSGAKGKRKLWTPRIEKLGAGDFDDAHPEAA